MKRKNWDDWLKILTKANVELIGTFDKVKQNYNFKCLTCNNQWNTYLPCVTSSFNKFGFNPCPKCAFDRKTSETRLNNIQKINDLGYLILGIYDPNITGVHNKLLVHRLKCGHEFSPKINNLLSGKSICPVCNTIRKKSQMIGWNKQRAIPEHRLSEWEKYKKLVGYYTNKNYQYYKNKINPDNLTRGRCGSHGAYQLDHIVPISWCFKHGVPAMTSGHQDNLQMITWLQNIQYKDKLKLDNIPDILFEYVNNPIKTEHLIVITNIERIKQTNELNKQKIIEYFNVKPLQTAKTIADELKISYGFTVNIIRCYCRTVKYSKYSKLEIENILRLSENYNGREISDQLNIPVVTINKFIKKYKKFI